MCGEKAYSLVILFVDVGSPPHVRGKETAVVILACIDRITPACAGKSIDGFCDFFDIQDHPRMCGEKS